MKSILFFLLMSLFISCKQDVEPYLTGYEKFRPDMLNLLSKVDKEELDSTNLIVDKYLKGTAFLSCRFCLLEVAEFSLVKDFCKRHPKCLVKILDRILKGEGLNLIFIKLFKELYPVEFQKLLDKEGVVLVPESEITDETPEWIKYKEFSLPFETYVIAYINLTKI
jgi:hypothetical protein